MVVFAPTGGAMESVPACAACAEEVDAGRAPPSRKAILDGRPQPYYRSPAHVGYFGRTGETLDDLLAVRLGALPVADPGLGLFDVVGDWLVPTV